MIGNGDWKEKL